MFSLKSAVKPSKRSRVLVRKETTAAYLFLLPSLIFFLGFVIFPIVLCVWTSFFDSTMNSADVLKNIREQDAEIYIIYLTNKDFVEDHIGEFDQTVKKKELAKEIDNVVRRLTRALSRDLSLKNEREIENNYKLQKEYLDERIEALKEYLRK